MTKYLRIRWRFLPLIPLPHIAFDIEPESAIGCVVDADQCQKDGGSVIQSHPDTASGHAQLTKVRL